MADKFNKEQSRLKMVILTQNKHENKVWYSFINRNRKELEKTMQSMLRRLENQPKLYEITNVVQFYEKGVKIAELKRK